MPQKRHRPHSSSDQHQNHAVYHAGQRPEHNDRSGHGEHLRCHAGDEALWLCQDRHTKFFEIIWAAHFSVGRFCHGALFGLNQHTHPTDKIGIGTIPLWLIQESQLDSKISHFDAIRIFGLTQIATQLKNGIGKNYIMLCCRSRCLNTSSKEGPSSLYVTLAATFPTRTQYGFFTCLR